MQLLYKPDWEETKERYLAWWEGEIIGRCALAVRAPRTDAALRVPPVRPDDPVERWTNLDYIAALNDYVHATTFYGGEAFPIWDGGTAGLTSIDTFLGSPITFDMEAGWWSPTLTGETWTLDDLPMIWKSQWYGFALNLFRRIAHDVRGKAIASFGSIGAPGDCLASLRGTERLLLDLVDAPDMVRATQLRLADIWMSAYEVFYQIMRDVADGGSSCWINLWAPGRFYAIQCDVSYMISARMFEDLFVPALERQVQYLDHAIYHCDGVGAFRLLPVICDIPGLEAVQILPGAGRPSPLTYLDDLRLVQAKGKRLQISLPPEDVQTGLELLSSRGLLIKTRCESEEQARWMLKQAETWSHD